jgi:hypothetical protein
MILNFYLNATISRHVTSKRSKKCADESNSYPIILARDGILLAAKKSRLRPTTESGLPERLWGK